MENKYLVEKDRCTGCSACKNVCPTNAISMEYDSEGFLYPITNATKCIDCKACGNVCPVKNPKSEYPNYLKTYAGYSTNSEIIETSTSGGFIATLSKYIIRQKGIVFGVRYDSDYIKSCYTSVEKEEDLFLLSGSKYVQSEKGEIFKQVKEALKTRLVLFVGCPCDVSALKLFLKKEYENLYTCELVCMGVTSYKIGEEYKKYTEEKNKSKLTSINARSKKNGWFVPHLEENFENGKTKLTTLFGSYYGYGFQVYNRPSCFNCSFRDKNGVADFRVGDFWGIKESDEFWNPKGVSCIFVRTDRGEEIVQKLKDMEFKLFETDYTVATKNNMSSTKNKGEKYQKLRDKFAKIYLQEGLVPACKKTETISVKIKRLMPKGLRVLAKKIYHKLRDKK